MSTVTFYVISENEYKLREIEIVKSLAEGNKQVLYVNFFKTSSEVMDSFGPWASKITCLAKKGPKDSTSTLALADPSSLSELSIVLNGIMKRKRFDVAFFDSFCGLNAIHGPQVCKKFFMYLRSHLALQNVNFVAASKDNESASQLVPLLRGGIDTLSLEVHSKNIYKEKTTF
ncbi:MAG: hypothetical protein AABX53_04075 [Nanoarchaeota archaeon]